MRACRPASVTPRITAAMNSSTGALWLQVRDLLATQAELISRGVPIAREARRESWGLHEMHVIDPDGITLIFIEVPGDHPLRRDTRGDSRGTVG